MKPTKKSVFNVDVSADMPAVKKENLNNTYKSTETLILFTQNTLLFFDAPGGTGKRFVSKTVLGYFNLKGKNVLTVEKSAAAAQILPCVTKAYCYFNTPIPCEG